MDFINDFILSINDFIWTYILIAMLIAIGVYFTFKTKFVQFTNFKEKMCIRDRDLFVVGYGLDYEGYYRNVPYVFNWESK